MIAGKEIEEAEEPTDAHLQNSGAIHLPDVAEVRGRTSEEPTDAHLQNSGAIQLPDIAEVRGRASMSPIEYPSSMVHCNSIISME